MMHRDVPTTVITGNLDLFTLSDSAEAAHRLVEQLQALDRELGNVLTPPSAEAEGVRIADGGAVPTAAEVRQMAAAIRDDEDVRSGERRIAKAALDEARRIFESKVRLGDDYVEQLSRQWAALLNEVRSADDLRSKELVDKANRIRRVHLQLLGPEVRLEMRNYAFLDSRIAPAAIKSELAKVGGRGVLTPAGPGFPGEPVSEWDRLRWLAADTPYLALSLTAANNALDAWHHSSTNFVMEDRPPGPAVRSTIRREGGA